MITPEDERTYKLPPLPDVPFCGKEEAERRRAEYQASRRGRNLPFERAAPTAPGEP